VSRLSNEEDVDTSAAEENVDTSPAPVAPHPPSLHDDSERTEQLPPQLAQSDVDEEEDEEEDGQYQENGILDSDEEFNSPSKMMHYQRYD
jgi:hypothetical protein